MTRSEVPPRLHSASLVRAHMPSPDQSDQSDSSDSLNRLLPKHGGYRKLRSFQTAQLVYDATVIFSERFIERSSRTRRRSVHAEWTALKCTPKNRTSSCRGTTSRKACCEKSGRT